MKTTLQRIRKTLFGTRHRTPLILLAVLAAIGLVVGLAMVFEALVPKQRGLSAAAFPVERVRGEIDLFTEFGTGVPAQIDIRGVSDDGKWICVSSEQGVRHWFFDVEQRRFVGKTRYGWHFLLDHGWKANGLVGFQVRRNESFLSKLLNRLPGPTRAGTRTIFEYHLLDIPSRQSRFLLFVVVTQHGHVLAWNAKVNRRHTMAILPPATLLPVVWPGVSGYRESSPEFVVMDFKKGRRRVVKQSAFGLAPKDLIAAWDWLPDDRTVLFVKYARDPLTKRRVPEAFHLFDARKGKAVSKVRLDERFEHARRQGRLEEGEDQLTALDILAAPEQGNLLRFVATFTPAGEQAGIGEDRASVWDLDLNTGELVRRMKIEEGLLLPVFSPSGKSVLAALTPSATRPAGGYDASLTEYRPTRLAIQTIGHPPRQLPVEVPLLYRRDGTPIFLGSRFSAARFLDENTLIHTGSGMELRTFDLRTSESTLLWKAGKNPQHDGVPTVDDFR